MLKYLKKLIFSHFMLQHSDIRFFPKKIIWANSVLSSYCNFMEKSENFQALTFDKTWKTPFWAHFGSLLIQKPQNKIFPKRII